MPYDRDAAIGYAKRYWGIPCPDGWIAITGQSPIIPDSVGEIQIEKARKFLNAFAKDGWQPRFAPYFDGRGRVEEAVFERFFEGKTEQKTIQRWAGLADCAHFLSSCISAGGVAIKDVSVPKMVAKLKARPDVKVLAERVTRERGQMVVDTGFFKKADIVAYFNIDPNGDYGRLEYTHSAMYVRKLDEKDAGRITCHTKSRFPGLSSYPDEWHLQDTRYTYTFIHIAKDDVAPSRALTSSLVGWWERSGDAGGYYFLKPNGTATFTARPPATHLDGPRATLNTAYWFVSGAVLTFFWRKGGNVEKWKPSGGPTKFKTLVNDVPGPSVVKIERAPGRHGRR